MVLVDTNIWIEFFKKNDPYFDEVSTLLQNRMVITLEPVFSELLYGVRTVKDKEIVQNYWNIIPKIDFQNESLIKASEYANKHKFYSLGIGLIDAVIIKSVIDNDLLVWTLDMKMLNHLDDKYIFNVP